jgi:UMF1 family MFS transporter
MQNNEGIADTAAPITEVKNNKRIQTGWTMYDWANSVYSLSIASAIFPIFYEKFTPKSATIFGFEFSNTALYDFSLSLSFLVVVALVPLLSGIADFGGWKKPFMRFFILLGSIACGSLYFFEGGNILFGLGCFILATIGWAGSLVFYNSYLPEIATPDKFDRLSARGYTMGYIGSVLLLVLNILFLQKSEWFGLPAPSKTSTMAFQVGFLTVGLWWLLWSLWPLWVLPKIKGTHQGKITNSTFLNGYKEIRKVFSQVLKMRALMIFLAAFFAYTMGVQTIIYVAAIFGSKTLQLEPADLLKTILLIQLIGIAGAYFFAWVADKWGNKTSLMATLIIWVLVCVLAFYVEPKQPNQFFGLACVVGTVMGGIQSLSRATYAKLVPGDKDNTSFFSFYEVTEKLAIVLGTLSFGLIDHITGNMRNSILMLMLFFIAGMVILMFVPTDKLRGEKNGG